MQLSWLFSYICHGVTGSFELLAKLRFSHQIGHTCDSQRRKTRHYQLMWVLVTLMHSVLLSPLPFTTVCVIFIVNWFCPVADCITDPIIFCDDLLWDRPHCWRVQRHGRLLRAEKQVSWVILWRLPPLIMWLLASSATGEACSLLLLHLK